ncbi:hypothetical protein [Marinobacter sp.]|uniref:hypothetical protein n=1 Tax=Marinobacter sp. TaxID=50741 RepID=UPI00257FC348|nr:hypothetical protein [Marinobacter sp.]|tara:strand:- start:1426 stop:1812 length:387 start_codon:yes stop_codon:yes gene_type:complete
MLKLFKLVTGEQLIGKIDTDSTNLNQRHICIVDPVEIKAINISKGLVVIEQFSMVPWMRIAKTSTMNVLFDSVVVMTDVADDAVEQYNNFIDGDVTDDFIGSEEIKTESVEEDYAEQLQRAETGKTIH